MGIAILVRGRMRNAGGGDPENWAALKSQRGADCQKILHPLRRLIAAVRQQPVVSHANAQASRNPPQEHGDEQGLPGKEKERRHNSDVKEPHEYRRHPINFAVSSLSFLQTFELHFHEGPRLFGVNYLLYVGYQDTIKVTVILA